MGAGLVCWQRQPACVISRRWLFSTQQHPFWEDTYRLRRERERGDTTTQTELRVYRRSFCFRLYCLHGREREVVVLEVAPGEKWRRHEAGGVWRQTADLGYRDGKTSNPKVKQQGYDDELVTWLCWIGGGVGIFQRLLESVKTKTYQAPPPIPLRRRLRLASSVARRNLGVRLNSTACV